MNHHVSHVFLILNHIACLHKLLLKCNAALTCRIRVLCAYITAQMRIDVVGQNIHIGHDFILQDLCARVYPVGRLDKDSEGLLLMTNQGELANEIMHAGNFHEKEYLVTVDQPFNAAFLKKMREGVELKELGVTTRPCKVEAAGAKTFRIILTQGLNRQIRRMCAELGYRVVTLKRVRIMNIHLGKLNTGDFRRATPKELEELEWQLEQARMEREEADLPDGEEA